MRLIAANSAVDSDTHSHELFGMARSGILFPDPSIHKNLSIKAFVNAERWSDCFCLKHKMPVAGTPSECLAVAIFGLFLD
jgi:hypothetical protein